MDPLHVTHLILLCMWAGLIAAELVLEISARDDDARRSVAIAHYRIDLFAELPLLLAILLTGSLLVARAWPLDRLHWIKVGCGTGAVVANLYCVVEVVRRHRARENTAIVRALTRRVFASAYVGVPLGAVAAYLGIVFFRA